MTKTQVPALLKENRNERAIGNRKSEPFDVPTHLTSDALEKKLKG